MYRHGLLTVLSMGVAMQVFLLYHYGIQLAVDSTFYIEEATTIRSGQFPPIGRSIWYITYFVILASFDTHATSLYAVVIFQMIISIVVTTTLYYTAKKIFNSRLAGLIAALLYTLWLPLQEWNTFIYTESLFTSFCLLIGSGLILATHRYQYFMIGVLFIITFFLRPTGFGLLAAGAVYLLISVKNRYGWSIFWACIIPVFLLVIWLLNTMLQSYELIDSYAKAEIIYPNITLGVKPPETLRIPDKVGAPLIDVIIFFSYHPVYFLKLFLIKLILFFGNVKPYFSMFHNVLIVGVLYPCYYFAIRSFRQLQGYQKEKSFILTFIFVQALTVSLTTENWDGRFLLPVLPFVFLLAAGRIAHLIQNRSLIRK